jgi:GTPase SAR1 family protein
VFFVTACSVMIVGNHSAGKSSFINWYIGERVVKTGVAIETRGFILCTSGRCVWLAYRAPARGIGALVQNSTQGRRTLQCTVGRRTAQYSRHANTNKSLVVALAVPKLQQSANQQHVFIRVPAVRVVTQEMCAVAVCVLQEA